MRVPLPQRHRTRARSSVIVQRGQLINAGCGFPAKNGIRVAGADECLVGKPVEFPEPLSVSARSGIPGVLADVVESVISFAGRVILGAWPLRAKRSFPIAGRNGGGNFLWDSRAFKECEQIRRPEFVNLALQPSRAIVLVHAQTRGRIHQDFTMHIASRNRRDPGNEPAFRAM